MIGTGARHTPPAGGSGRVRSARHLTLTTNPHEKRRKHNDRRAKGMEDIDRGVNHHRGWPSILCCVSRLVAASAGRGTDRRGEAGAAEGRQATEDWVVSKLQYFKDPRTNLCFAYIWEGDYRGGLGLATVSCDRIPLNLLNTAHYRQWTDLGPTQQPAD